MKALLHQIMLIMTFNGFPTDSGWSYFHMLTDNQTKKIIAVELTPDVEKETI